MQTGTFFPARAAEGKTQDVGVHQGEIPCKLEVSEAQAGGPNICLVCLYFRCQLSAQCLHVAGNKCCGMNQGPQLQSI